MAMFCYQCEQTAGGTGCTKYGACGKDPEVAALQDLLVHALKGVGQYGHCARTQGAKDAEVDRFLLDGLFATLTNVNFDPADFEKLLRRAAVIRDKAKKLCGTKTFDGPAAWQPAADRAGGQARQNQLKS